MNIIEFEKIDSTNTYAKKEIDTLEDKTVVSANYQTAGRGRFDRNWVDLGSENIYMTIILKPSSILKPNHACLTQYLSYCLCLELEKMGLSPEIRWPNDVLIENKKVCGILAESVIKQGELKGIALGIGINLNSDTQSLNKIDRPATSINLHLGEQVNKKTFMQNLLSTFFNGYEDFLEKGFESIKDYYESHACFKKGEKIKLAIFKTIATGSFEGFNKDGTIILKMENSSFQSFNMGELVL